MTVSIRQRYLTSQWEVILHYGFRETLLALRNSREEAREYARDYCQIVKQEAAK